MVGRVAEEDDHLGREAAGAAGWPVEVVVATTGSSGGRRQRGGDPVEDGLIDRSVAAIGGLIRSRARESRPGW